MKIGRLIVTLAVGLLVAITSGCGSWLGPRAWVESHERLSVPVQAQRFEVKTHNGTVDITGTSGASGIEVLVTKKAGARSQAEARACMKAIEVVQAVSGGSHRLEWRWRTRRPGCQAQVSFEVTLPERLSVRASSHNGALSVRGMAAPAELEAHNGAIEVSAHSGDLRAKSHNGAIEAQAVVREIHLTTHNGRINLDLSGSRVVDGEIHSHNGRVEVELGEQASTRVSCRTRNGSAHADYLEDVERPSKKRLEARAGQGDGRLEITTNNGSITVRE